MTNQKHTNDFQTTSLLREKTKKHEESIRNLEQRLNRIEKRVGNNEQFAKSFANSLSSQTTSRNAVIKTVSDAIKTDTSTAGALKDFIDRYDRHKLFSSLRGVGGALFWIIITALITYFVPIIFNHQ